MRAILVLLLLVATGCHSQSTCSPEQEKILAPEGGLRRSMQSADKICGFAEDSLECREARKELNSLKVCYYYLTR
jgi:hypothetical protein